MISIDQTHFAYRRILFRRVALGLCKKLNRDLL
jgi:hypothetical protein